MYWGHTAYPMLKAPTQREGLAKGVFRWFTLAYFARRLTQVETIGSWKKNLVMSCRILLPYLKTQMHINVSSHG
jgi:hypothetical protein